MTQLSTIHSGKTPRRVHFIAEWAERRGLKQVDVVRATGADKSTVSRWFDGQLPKESNLDALVEALSLEEPADLFRSPDDDWMARFFRDKSEEERKRAIEMLQLAFPRKVA